MPNDPQRQLDALKRGMCGDCGVGPFKGGRRGGRASKGAAVWIGLGLLLLGIAGAGLLAWLG